MKSTLNSIRQFKGVDMAKLNVRFGLLAMALLAASPVSAEPNEAAFLEAINSQKSQEVTEQEGQGDDEEVKVENIDVPALFKDIDNHQARIRRLEQMVNIAELEQEYMNLTGRAPEGAVTVQPSSGSKGASEEMASMLRSEINSLKQQIDGMVSRLNERPSPAVEQMAVMEEMQADFKKTDAWEVKGISIYGDNRSAVISGVTGNDFMVRQGQEVGGVRVVSIAPESVRVREKGETTEIPLAGTGYTGQETMPMPPDAVIDGWETSQASGSSQRNQPVAYPEIPDSTSR